MLDEPAEDPPVFEGVEWPKGAVIDTWFAFRNFGILPFAGGLLDQPEEWWRTIRVCEAIYNYAYNEHRRKRKSEDKDS